MRSKSLFDSCTHELKAIYGEQEAGAIALVLLEDAFKVSRDDVAMNREVAWNEDYNAAFNRALERLKNHEPVQYVTGLVHFFDMQLKCDKRALIPRPETEELVYKIKNERREVKKILDVGTGSACIALALKKCFPNAEVQALDLSLEALKLAKENAEITKLAIETLQVDILQWNKYPWSVYDLIVSNPPYVSTLDKEVMQKNVLDFEPHVALFSEEDPLLFYRHIFDFAAKTLSKTGALYFELNESFGKETAKLGMEKGFNTELYEDIHGKTRFLKAQRSQNTAQ